MEARDKGPPLLGQRLTREGRRLTRIRNPRLRTKNQSMCPIGCPLNKGLTKSNQPSFSHFLKKNSEMSRDVVYPPMKMGQFRRRIPHFFNHFQYVNQPHPFIRGIWIHQKMRLIRWVYDDCHVCADVPCPHRRHSFPILTHAGRLARAVTGISGRAPQTGYS